MEREDDKRAAGQAGVDLARSLLPHTHRCHRHVLLIRILQSIKQYNISSCGFALCASQLFFSKSGPRRRDGPASRGEKGLEGDEDARYVDSHRLIVGGVWDN